MSRFSLISILCILIVLNCKFLAFQISDCEITSDVYDGLQALFYATNGADWYNQQEGKSPWQFPSNLSKPCSFDPWFGLTCNVTTNANICIITELKLTGNSLTGTIPTEIGLLTDLSALYLDENFLSGSIPCTIGNLIRLQTLNFQICSMNSTIPSEIGFLQKLISIDFSSNNLFGGIPSEIGNISLLVNLNLEYNELSKTLPSQLGMLRQLQTLNIAVGNIGGPLPTEIGLLTNLRGLDIFSNSFTGWIPTEIGNLQLLNLFSVSSSLFSGPVPSELGLCTAMVTLDLSLSQFTGEIPSELCNLRLLVHFSLSDNYLAGPIPTEIGQLNRMTQLDFSSNSLTGPIPIGFNDLLFLDTISLGANYLTGLMLQNTRGFKQLEELDLGFNQLTGTIVDAWSSQQVSIYLNNNMFNGTIPSIIGNLTNLYLIYLHYNSLTGSIPSEFGHLLELNELYLYDNQISSSIPTEFCLLQALQTAALSENHIGGSLPDCLGNMKGLLEFDLSSNSLTGSLPSSLPEAVFLNYITLSDNMLTGTLDPLRATRNLDCVYLQRNRFSGPIYSELFKSNGILSSFDVSDNHLTGTIPPEFADSLFSFTFIAKKNKLTGSLPRVQWMGNDFDVSGNNLNGSLPESLSTWHNLNSINLSNNSFTGSIPHLLFNISALNIVTLNNNKFSGNVSFLANASHVQGFSAANNSFSGPLFSIFGDSLLSVDLSSNLISGPVSPDCLSASHISALFLASNKFEGNLSSLYCFGNLTVLSLENNSFTGSVEYLASMKTVEQVILNDNLLSGTLPSVLSTMSTLKALLLAGNRFTGQPDIIFNASVQQLLTAVDLSNNDFTGTIPSNVFTLPNLESFASIKTCFSGSLPSTVCACSTLKVLLMDGVNSGLSCQHRFDIVHSSDAYVSTNGPVTGGIPECIWGMPLLQSLHLSSNGLTGTIADLPSGSNLTSVVLSYNQLSGTIPTSLQGLPFTTLELTSNRLKGMYSEDLVHPDAVVYLQNNRLSGMLPSSFTNASQINVMQGNLFNCDEQHPKPSQDMHSSETSCGSTQLNYSLLLWGCVTAVFLVVSTVTVMCVSVSQGQVWRTVLASCCRNTVNVFVDSLTPFRGPCTSVDLTPLMVDEGESISPSGEQFLTSLQTIVAVQISSFVLISLLVCIPIYVCLKFVAGGKYSTHTYQYQWLVSATFLTGIPPAVFMLLIWVAVVLIYTRCVLAAHAKNVRVQSTIAPLRRSRWSPVASNVDSKDPSNDNDATTNADWMSSTKKRRIRWLCCMLFGLFHVVVMICLNVLYLYVILSGKFTVVVMTLCQVSVSAFKVLWEILVIPGVIRTFRGYLKDNKEGLASQAYSILRFGCSVCSALVIPFIVSLFVNSLCFLDIFVPQSVVNENFFYNLASRTTCIVIPMPSPNITTPVPVEQQIPNSITECLDFSQVQEYSTEFYPPFTYSFQCGSGILTSYTPVLVYSFTFRIVAVAGRHIWRRFLGRKSSANSFDKQVSGLMTALMLYSLVLLTFGLANPALAAVVVFCALVDVQAFFQDAVEGRSSILGNDAAIVDNKKDEEIAAEASSMRDLSGYSGVWRIPKQCMWTSVYLGSVFWSLILFDSIGDTNVLHPAQAWWGPFLVVIIPCLLQGCDYWWSSFGSTEPSTIAPQASLVSFDAKGEGNAGGSHRNALSSVASSSVDSLRSTFRSTIQQQPQISVDCSGVDVNGTPMGDSLFGTSANRNHSVQNPIRFPVHEANSNF